MFAFSPIFATAFSDVALKNKLNELLKLNLKIKNQYNFNVKAN